MYDDFTCPHCGEELSAGATFCPACGSDDETGWSEFADYPGLDLPDEAEDEFEREATLAPRTRWQSIVIGTALLLLAIFAYSLFWGFF